ncbi:MAG: tetratricopeptide repeat protein [Gemmataceae bacterium]
MATQTAPAAFPYPLPDPGARQPLPARPRPRVLWPWPMFLLGAAALAVVAVERHRFQPTSGDRLRRDLNEMRRLVERAPSDLGRARALGQHILEKADAFPQFVGETHYLLGCVHLRKAEDPAALEGDAELKEAIAHFEKAEVAGVPDADQPRLAHKLGKVLFLLNTEPEVALDKLLRGEDPDNPVERWDMLAEAHLRVGKPNLDAALEATQSELAIAPPNGDVQLITRARVRQADLQRRLGRSEDAIHTLERIDRNAPSDLYFASRTQLAQCLEAKGDWRKAAKAWQEIKSSGQVKPAERAAVSYRLGWCYAKLAQPIEAAEAWKDAQVAGGEAGQAAILRQAELDLPKKDKRAEAIAALERGLDNVVRPADYRNELVPAAEVRKLLETACRTFQTEADFAAASKAADLYVKLVPSGKGRELPAEVATAWGQKLWKDAERAAGPTAAHGRDEAKLQFRKAGGLFAEAASADRPVGEQVDCLSRAVDQYFKAADKLDLEAGNVLLERMEKLDPARAADGEGAYRKAISLQNLGDKAKAIEEFRKIAQQPTSLNAPRARFQLSLLLRESLPENKAEAKRVLADIVADLEKNNDPAVAEKDRETHELSLYLLAFTVYDLRDFLKAESCLETALQHYPLSSQAKNARFLLGRCSWYQAASEQRVLARLNDGPDRDATEKRYLDFLKKSREASEQVEAELLALEKDKKLIDADRSLLRQASFAAADGYFFVGAKQEIAEAARRYKELRVKYEGTLSEIVALSQLWQCYEVYLGEHDKAIATFEALRDALKKVPNTEFDGSTHYNKRDFWENWLKDVEKKMAAAPPQ